MLILSTAHAQLELTVNGVNVPGITTSLVPGSSYSPAEAFADAIGADYYFDYAASVASFEYGAHILSVRVFDSPGTAARETNALSVDTQARASQGGVIVDGVIYVPVKPLVQALGGSIDYLEYTNTVVAVLPRAALTSAVVSNEGTYDRLTLTINNGVPFDSFYNETLRTLQLRFDRTDLQTDTSALSGRFFSNARVSGALGYVDVRLTLQDGYTYEVFTSPKARGYDLVVDIIPTSSNATLTNSFTRSRSVIIDPGHGGSDTGLTFDGYPAESTLTLEFATQLVDALQTRGISASLTRTSNTQLSVSERSQLGTGAGLFISVHAGDLSSGEYNLFYLGEAFSSAELDMAIRINAETATQSPDTNALRRELLLGLVPDVSLGQQYARQLSDELLQTGGYQQNTSDAAPLSVLLGAAGRGLLIEFSPQDLSSDSLVENLADAISAMLANGTN